MKKLFFYTWDYMIPYFIKNFIKYNIFVIKYKNKIWIKTIENLSLWYILSNNLNLWKNINLWNSNIILWNIDIWDYTYLNWPNTKLVWGNKHKILIWKLCSISWWVQIITNNFHNKNKLTTSDSKDIHKLNKNNWWNVIIWNDVWIWCNVIILPWITIWNWAIIWAGSIVTKNIPSYAIAVWNPAKIINYRFEEKTIQNLENIKRWDWDIEKIKKNYDLNFLNN